MLDLQDDEFHMNILIAMCIALTDIYFFDMVSNLEEKSLSHCNSQHKFDLLKLL